MPTIQPSAFAVVATHLAQTDRRTLSQAWFDALHLAHEPDAARTVRPANAATGAVQTQAERPASAATAGTSDRPPHAANSMRTEKSSQHAVAHERRSERSELSRRIDRAIVRRTAVPIASLAIRAADGRVQLLVRSDGNRTRIVALCVPGQRTAVEAALAHARFALAKRGILIDADVRSAA